MVMLFVLRPRPSTSCGIRKSRTSSRKVTKREKYSLRPKPASQVSPSTDSWNVRPAPASAKMSPWTMVASVNLNLAWIGDHSSDAIALAGGAGREVLLG